MIIGVPTETKTREYRVGINPGGVSALTAAGHEVRIQSGAGLGSGLTDDVFRSYGATIVPTAADAWAGDMVMKVKEPLPSEYQYFREGQVLYTYLHLAPLPELLIDPTSGDAAALARLTLDSRAAMLGRADQPVELPDSEIVQAARDLLPPR